jgi:hypothetical protein
MIRLGYFYLKGWYKKSLMIAESKDVLIEVSVPNLINKLSLFARNKENDNKLNATLSIKKTEN